ncbi:MAG: hypothetical protein ISR98_02190 [Parcubacteria group bacterium]|nr:hypothetical protein [Parcubacteria group bacterium]
MSKDRDRSSIEEMRKRLYARDQRSGKRGRRQLNPIDYDSKSKWSDQSVKPVFKEKKKKRRSLLSTLLIASVIFFVLAIGISAFFIFGGSNVVSSQNIDIDIQGPVTISGGEELSLQVAITNKNNVAIKLADLLVEYPDGTRSSVDISKALLRHRETIGTLTPGEIIQKTVKAILLGSEDSQQNIKVTVEYRIDGSNAIFFTEKMYDVTLVSAPLSLSVSNINEITSGQEVDFDITVTSNSNTVIKDALLSVEYPFGFEFVSATPEPAFTDKVWDLGDIQPEGKRIIKLRGVIIGEDNEERVFRFSSGVKSEKDEKELEVAFVTSLKSVFIKKPFIGVNLALNGDQGSEYVSAIGDNVRADITWMNNMPVRVSDAEIEVKLRGEALDKFSIVADRGFYRSSDNTITYSRETDGNLATLNPGDSGSVTFSFASLGASSGNIFKNPEIIIDISIKGKRLSENQVPQEIDSSITKKVLLASDLFLTSRALYFTGPFTNTGPLPPKVEQETTYTVIWTVTNSSNIVDNTEVTATLPSYIRWVGQTNPSNADISFNPVGGKIVWNVGSIKPKADTSSSGQAEVAFKVALLPSISQIGVAPILINEQVITGFDRFTSTNINNTKKELTTRLSTDPNFATQDANVVE